MSSFSFLYFCDTADGVFRYLISLESANEQHDDDVPFFTIQWRMVAHVFHHTSELQTQVIASIKRPQVVFKGNASVLLMIPFQRIEHHKAKSVDEPRLEANVW